jgi:CRISP-associated protein Cas1
MLKRTLFFSSPYYLSTKLEQLIATPKPEGEARTMPIEDIGFLVLDHPQITVSFTAIEKLAANNVAVIYCDAKHHPSSLLLPLDSNYRQSERYRFQIDASEPLKKQLWKQTMQAKITNQAFVLKTAGSDANQLYRWAKEVKSGDSDNREALAAAYYWQRVFKPYLLDFQRDREGLAPNNLLNYGYAILRAATARALVGAGLLPTLGIHHHNKYNAYCLADDIMEPYRPFVDREVLKFVTYEEIGNELTTKHKTALLKLLGADTQNANDGLSPLMITLSKTAQSLAACYMGERNTLFYPNLT